MTLKSLRAVAAFAVAAALAPQAMADIDLSTPEGVLKANRKINCSTIDEKPITYSWHGKGWSRRRGEADQNIFDVVGMNVRMCVADEHPERGKGYRLISREILLYTDPKTGQALDIWENPWTGKAVKVIHVENDPVNSANYLIGRDGKPLKWTASEHSGSWWRTATVPLFYHNVLAGDYQRYVGNAYHATEMFNYFGEIADLVDDSKDTAAIKVGWVRQSEWLPWMQMQGREGIIYMHTAGKKVAGYDDLPEVMRTYIETRAPKYAGPPPSDDKRPNETSWTYFKKMVKSETLPRGGH